MRSIQSNVLIRTRIRLPGVITRVYRTAAGLFMPAYDAFVPKYNNVIALLGTAAGTILIPGCNIVTDAGDIYFAQRSAGEAPTNSFTTFEMCTSGTPAKGANRSAFAVISGSQQAQDSGYPRTNDSDTDNTGRATDVRTARVSYTTGAFTNGAITHGLITNPTPGANEALLTGWAFAASFGKSNSETLKVFHNATLNGV